MEYHSGEFADEEDHSLIEMEAEGWIFADIAEKSDQKERPDIGKIAECFCVIVHLNHPLLICYYVVRLFFAVTCDCNRHPVGSTDNGLSAAGDPTGFNAYFVGAVSLAHAHASVADFNGVAVIYSVYAVFAEREPRDFLSVSLNRDILRFSPVGRKEYSECRRDNQKRGKDVKPENPKPLKPSKSANETEVANPNEKIHFGVPHSEWVKLSHEEKVALGQAAYDAEAAKIDSTYLERKKAHDAEIAARPFKHTSENVISSIFSLNYGDHVLMGDFHPTLQEDFLKSLNDPIVINDDDSEEVRLQKEEMIALKPKIKELLDKGYTLKEILDDYRSSIAKVQELEFNLRKELDEIKRTSTSVDEVRDFIAAANKMMLDAGAKNFTYHLSEGAIRKILINAERSQQGENNE